MRTTTGHTADGEDRAQRRWLGIALGPLLFLCVELFFRPTLPQLDSEVAASGAASAEAVRHTLAATV
jgi:hypothetical protein